MTFFNYKCNLVKNIYYTFIQLMVTMKGSWFVLSIKILRSQGDILVVALFTIGWNPSLVYVSSSRRWSKTSLTSFSVSFMIPNTETDPSWIPSFSSKMLASANLNPPVAPTNLARSFSLMSASWGAQKRQSLFFLSFRNKFFANLPSVFSRCGKACSTVNTYKLKIKAELFHFFFSGQCVLFSMCIKSKCVNSLKLFYHFVFNSFLKKQIIQFHFPHYI